MVCDDTSLRSQVVEPVSLLASSLSLSLVGVLYVVVVHGLTRVLGHVVLIALGNLRTIAVVELLGEVLETYVGIVAHGWLTVLTVLGGDQDNTVGTVRTVDSGSRGVLQDFHRLDIVGVDIVQRTTALRDGDTVNDDVRTSSGIDRVASTNQCSRSVTRN